MPQADARDREGPFFVKHWWDEKAKHLRQGVRHDEAGLDSSHVFTEDEVRKATVHSREDMVLIVSYLSSANRQLAIIRWVLIVLTIVVIMIGLKVTGYGNS
jgi:hypothetical protein